MISHHWPRDLGPHNLDLSTECKEPSEEGGRDIRAYKESHVNDSFNDKKELAGFLSKAFYKLECITLIKT